ncbi:NAD(P)/FAD-dependent oxidoreductase [Cohnella silvisoli]|uniref:FAD-dependent oxidoreductase n=1 Tax=Cohnella silvisoli TaxID=2873699 RepID=A0ABV1KW70_9BACL|nr:FAD-dependent oxidoreductase [Cohnella silvisoli]MCD9023728.1 FAD-dependent oxidoreductase [Cohnella silvisoli]
MTERGMVILGAGEAGARAAVELRTAGWTGPVTLIGQEQGLPYERPPLSKRVLTTEEDVHPAVIHHKDWLAQQNITLLAGSRAERIDRFNRSVVLADGRQVNYERLLLATGAIPRKLTVQGSETAGVLYLRNFADALAIRAKLLAGRHVTVIGGGFIGLEVAASARERGCSVTLIEAGPRILMRGVPEAIAGIVQERHLADDVEFKVGAAIERIEATEGGHSIFLADGSVVRTQAIVVGIGAVPETTIAANCGLDTDNGVSVNEFLATSDSHIYAAGDCCSFPHPLYDGKRIRLEAWRNAQDQGAHASRNMLGAAESFATVPWFWSDQYEQTLQVTGLPDYGTRTISRDIGHAGRLYFHLTDEGRLVAASAIGSDPGIAKEIRIAEMLIERRAAPDPHDLENRDVKLKGLLK